MSEERNAGKIACLRVISTGSSRQSAPGLAEKRLELSVDQRCQAIDVSEKIPIPPPFELVGPSRYSLYYPQARGNWENVIPFFVFPEDIRRIIYTTNAIESLNMRLRKITKNRGHFPGDDSASKLIYLTLRNVSKKWTMPPHRWKRALTQFAIFF